MIISTEGLIKVLPINQSINHCSLLLNNRPQIHGHALLLLEKIINKRTKFNYKQIKFHYIYLTFVRFLT